MKEYPILFKGEMVKAILGDRKTQTRRVIPNDLMMCLSPEDEPEKFVEWCKYGAFGDRLWVRETWSPVPTSAYNVMVYDPNDPSVGAVHRAGWAVANPGTGWKPSIHMPRWASRITLEITGVRVERVQDICEEDAIAEGIESCTDNLGQIHSNPTRLYMAFPERGGGFFRARDAFECLWDSINAKRGVGWSENPWVWVVTFKRLRS